MSCKHFSFWSRSALRCVPGLSHVLLYVLIEPCEVCQIVVTLAGFMSCPLSQCFTSGFFGLRNVLLCRISEVFCLF